MNAVATLGLDPSRAVDPAGYALGRRAPGAAVKPVSATEAAEALKAASRGGLAVVPWGGGTQLDRSRAPLRYDLALDLSGLDRVLDYDPEDLTVTAECGVTIATLRATLGARGQELPLESPHAARATLGGVLAANASGPRRLRFGAPRDRILGARFALADGTLARSGGKVVKNVAGFAIHRLLCGSRGALAVMLEASLKLLPAPQTRAALIYAATRESLGDASRWTFLPRLEAAFVTVLGVAAGGAMPPEARSRADFTVIVGLEDDAAWVAEQEKRVTAALGPPARRLEGDQAVALAQALADAEDHATPRLTLTSPHNTPAALGGLVKHAAAPALVFHATAGRLHWFPGPGDDTSLVSELFGLGFTPIGVRGAVTYQPAIPPETGVRALRARIREALDPARSLSLGEVWEGGPA